MTIKNHIDKIVNRHDLSPELSELSQILKKIWKKLKSHRAGGLLTGNKADNELNGMDSSLSDPEEDMPNQVFIIHNERKDIYKLKNCKKFIEETLHMEAVVYRASRHDLVRDSFTAFDKVAKKCSAVIVLLSEDKNTKMIDENMLFKIGYFYGKFSTQKERKIIILYNTRESLTPRFNGIPQIPYYKSVYETFFYIRSQFRQWDLIDQERKLTFNYHTQQSFGEK
jgi:hypothetical protein